jgi:hypothetical protein
MRNAGTYIKGLDALLQKFDALGVTSRDRIGQTLHYAMLVVQAEAQRRCPVDKGFLKSSAFYVASNNAGEAMDPVNLGSFNYTGTQEIEMEIAKRNVLSSATHGGGVVFMYVAFGAAYALIVHEDLAGVVPRNGGVGEARFLANALVETTPNILKDIRENLKAGLLSAAQGGRKP